LRAEQWETFFCLFGVAIVFFIAANIFNRIDVVGVERLTIGTVVFFVGSIVYLVAGLLGFTLF
jgi:predicted membrane channel-forming protein YqfA (hemolysin III family)